MVTFDTNVVLRVVVRDDPAQCARAERAWRHALAGGGVLMTTTVLVEIAWVLRTAFNLDRTTRPCWPPQEVNPSAYPVLTQSLMQPGVW